MRRTEFVAAAALAALTFNAAPVAAQDDDPITYAMVGGGAMGWRDNSVSRDGGKVTVDMFVYVSEPEEGDYTWMIQSVTFDCAERTYTTIEGGYLSREGNKLSDVTPEMTWPAEAGTIEGIIRQVTCDGANLTDAIKAPNFNAVRQALGAQ